MQARFKVTIKKDPTAEKYSITVFETSTNPCRMGKGVRPSIYDRVFMQSFEQSSKIKIACPVRKNQRLVLNNLTLTDELLPPMPIEKKFKLHSYLYGKIKEKRGWTYIADTCWYGSYKK